MLTGEDIVVSRHLITDTQWEVPFKLSTSGAQKFAEAARGKAGQPVNMYLDDRHNITEISAEVATGSPQQTS